MGKKLIYECEKCGTPLQSSSSYCPECGGNARVVSDAWTYKASVYTYLTLSSNALLA